MTNAQVLFHPDQWLDMKVTQDAWSQGPRFALEAVSKVDSLCWLTESMKEVCIKLATEAVIAERDRLIAAGGAA